MSEKLYIGDRVRLMNSRDEGFINRIDGDLVYVALDDGFMLPVLKNEVAVIAKEEEKFTKDPASKPTTIAKKTEFIEKQNYPFDNGVYLIIERNENSISYIVFNYTSVLFSGALFGKPTNQRIGNEWIGMDKSDVNPHSFKLFFKELNEHATQRDEVLLEGFFFAKEHHIHLSPISKQFKVKELMIKGKSIKIRDFDHPVWMFSTNEKSNIPTAEFIRESILENKPNNEFVAKIKTSELSTRELEIDLHTEMLFPGENLDPTLVLSKQIEVFQKKLDEAIQQGRNQIIFIHGVGNGILRKEIQTHLGKHPHVKTFKDARKERFGYGATEAFIK